MSAIPRSPALFFGDYVPAHFARLGEELAGRSSPGAIVFDVGSSSWSLRLRDGKLDVETGVAPDALIRVTLAESEFESIIVGGAERLDGEAGLEKQLVAVRALTLDPDRARLLRESKGSVLLRLSGDEGEQKLLVSVGGEPKPDAPDCEIACALTDLWAIQSGAANPFQLLLDGKIRISGNVELALAVGAALG